MASLRYPLAERCNRYARAVVSGRTPANKWVTLACRRHLDDIKASSVKSYPFEFDKAKAERFLRFAGNMVHVKGKWAGQHMFAEDWQCFCFGAPFGWVRRKDRLRRFRELYLEIPRKSGKALDLDTIIPTPSGWTTMGEIGRGDFVFDESGKPCKVVATSDVFTDHDCYKITFSNGETAIADSGHLWKTTARIDKTGIGEGQGRDKQRYRPPKLRLRTIGGRKYWYAKLYRKEIYLGKCSDKSACIHLFKEKAKSDLQSYPMRISKTTRVRTTDEIYASFRCGSRNDANHCIQIPSPLSLPDRVLPVEPYVLGAWLGDGNSDDARISCGDHDVDFMVKQMTACGNGITLRRDKTAWRLGVHAIEKNMFGTNVQVGRFDQRNLHKRLKLLNLLGNKHIPEAYLRASFNQRLSLLQGLMDTDGTCDKSGKIQSFSNTNAKLIDGVAEILASLGIKYSCKNKPLRCNGKSVPGVGYTLQFNVFRDELPVFRLPRKLERMRLRSDCKTSPRSRTVQIVNVEPIDSVPVKCITVDSPEGMFLFGKSMLPTHNSPWGAIIGNYMAWADGEIGAEVLSGATSMEQAYEVFRPAWLMVHNNPEFKELFDLDLGGTVKNPGPIYRLKDGSRFQPVIGNPGDGASPSCAIVDEYHEHRTSSLYDTMRTGMVGREQPILAVITTAGVDTSVPCYDMHLDARKVLEGALQRDDLFTVIYGMDDEDDWQDFENWKKANPNFGVSVLEDALRARHHEAMTNPAKKNINLCKHANKWMNAGVAWMNMVKWEACRDDTLSLDDFENEECWIGLDLANRIDIAALRLVFRYQDGFVGFGRYYLPSETVRAKENSHYQKWVEEGLIVETDGARTDFGRIVEDLENFAGRFVLKELAYDPKEATFLIQEIQEKPWVSFECVEITQGPLLMSEPMKEWEGLIYSGNYAHNGDPVMTWMMGNVVKKQGRGGGPIKTYYPTKDRDANKIDGPVAELMALARALVNADDISIYETRGIASI